MKKLLYLLAFLITFSALGQTTNHRHKVKLTEAGALELTVPDSLLSFASDGQIRWTKLTDVAIKLNPLLNSGVLVALDEGNGIGFVRSGRDPLNFGNVGLNAFDFSISTSASSVFGATGELSWLFGEDNIASAYGSGGNGFLLDLTDTFAHGFGYDVNVSGYSGFGTGSFIDAVQDFSMAGGNGVDVANKAGFHYGIALRGTGAPGVTVLGTANVLFTGDGNPNSGTNPILVVGNGSFTSGAGVSWDPTTPSNILELLNNGQYSYFRDDAAYTIYNSNAAPNFSITGTGGNVEVGLGDIQLDVNGMLLSIDVLNNIATLGDKQNDLFGTKLKINGADDEIYLDAGGGITATSAQDLVGAVQSVFNVFENSTGTGVNNGLTIENLNTGDALQHFKVAALSYTMGIDNSVNDEFIIANGVSLSDAFFKKSTIALTLGDMGGNDVDVVLNGWGGNTLMTFGDGIATLSAGDLIVTNSAGSIIAKKRLFNDVTTAYTLGVNDISGIRTLSNAAAVALTVPTNATTAIAIGTEIILINKGVGVVTIGGAGITFRQNIGGLTMAQYDRRTLTKLATDEWLVSE